MASRKNKWRRRGRLEFRRETARYHDGLPMGYDSLFVRIHRKGCIIVQPFACASMPEKTLSVLCGTYRLGKPAQAAHWGRDYLNYKSMEA